MASPDQVPATATTDPATADPASTGLAASQDTTAPPPPAHHVIKRTRLGGAWVAVALFAVVLLLLLVFILENSHEVNIGYFGAHGHLPLGVALLLAAVLGILLVVIPGAGRMIQLRRTARRHRQADTAAAQAAVTPATTAPESSRPGSSESNNPAPTATSPPDGLTRT
ncbi:MAG: LapA family protein [Streptosporangiaceae bacterium]